MTRLLAPKSPNWLIRAGAAIVLGLAVVGTTLSSTAVAQSLTQPVSVSSTSSALSLTPSVTEGPYFKANSPEATDLVQDGMQGTVITVSGQVLDQSGNPVPNALLDFWHANASGAYDNSGYTLRGHQYTDANGFYTLTTIVPGLYPGRTEHIHVKVQAPNGPVLTTQLFFPGVAQNSRDSLYAPSLLLDVATNVDGTQSATFNFVVPTV